MRSLLILSTVSAASLASAAPTNPSYGKPPSGKPEWDHPGWHGGHHGYNQSGEPYYVAQERAAAVKQTFEIAWDGYYKLVYTANAQGSC